MIVALACGTSVSANAAILYSHTFDGNAADSLAAIAPDVANTGLVLGADHGTSTANWTDSDTWQWGKNNGTGVNQDGSFDDIRDTAVLPLSMQQGFVYTFEITGTGPSATDDFDAPLTIAYMRGTSAQVFHDSILAAFTQPNYTLGRKQEARYDTGSALSSGSAEVLGTADDSTSPSKLTIVVDTTDGAGGWDAEFYVNDTLFATKTNLGDSEARLNQAGFAGKPGLKDPLFRDRNILH